jgi:hypothetical protein
VFLRETRRTNRDGSVVSYLQLAHNERHPVSGNPVAKVIHSFGPESVNLNEAPLSRNYRAASSVSSGWLIQEAVGSLGGRGGLRTNRSGWAA